MEALFNEHLSNHCNTEWNVHFKALLQRLKGSLTCAGGLQPDHDRPHIPLNSQPTQSGLQGVSGQSNKFEAVPQISVQNDENNFVPPVSMLNFTQSRIATTYQSGPLVVRTSF